MKKLIVFTLSLLAVLLIAQTEVKISELDKETNIADNDIFIITFDSSSTWVSRGFIWSALVSEMEEDIRLDETQVDIDTLNDLYITTTLEVDGNVDFDAGLDVATTLDVGSIAEIIGVLTAYDTLKADEEIYISDNTAGVVMVKDDKYFIFRDVNSEVEGTGFRIIAEDFRVMRDNTDAQRLFHIVTDSTNNRVDVTIENELYLANASNDSALIRMDEDTENLFIGTEPGGGIVEIMERDSTATSLELTGYFRIISSGDDTVFYFEPENPMLRITNTSAGTDGNIISSIKNSATPASNDTITRHVDYLYNNAGTPEKIKAHEETVLIHDGTDGSEDARILKTAIMAGVETELYEFDPADRSFKFGKYTAIVDTITAGEDLEQWDALYLKSDGKYWESDADASTTMPVVAIAMEAINTDATGDAILFGYVYDSSWNWTPGAIIYASLTTGELTATAPSETGDQVQIVGYAKDADSIEFMPNLMLLEIE